MMKEIKKFVVLCVMYQYYFPLDKHNNKIIKSLNKKNYKRKRNYCSVRSIPKLKFYALLILDFFLYSMVQLLLLVKKHANTISSSVPIPIDVFFRTHVFHFFRLQLVVTFLYFVYTMVYIYIINFF